MKHFITALFITVFFIETVFTQNVQWTQTYGSTGDDGSEAMVINNDGSLVIAGFISAYAYSYKNVLLMKTNSEGTQIWSKTFDLNLNDIARALRKTNDGGYIISGMTEVTPQIFDPFLIKTDSLGNIQWQQQYDYGLGDDDRSHDVWQTSDGGYIIAGQTWLMHGSFGNYDMYIIKTDANGSVQWKKVFYRENEGGDVALGIQQLNNGGYIIGGFTQSSIWASYVIRTDSLGNAIWSNIYPGPWQTECYDIQATPDGGFIMTGTETSYETDGDVFLKKLDGNGNVLWNKIYGTALNESGEHIQQLQDGGYIIAGMSASTGSYDIYIVRTNSLGNSIWTSTVGGSSDDRGHAVAVASAGNYYISGWAWSYGQGLGDVYLLKITETLTGGIVNHEIPSTFKLYQNYPNPFNPKTLIKYQLSKNSDVKLIIYDITGKVIKTLIDQKQNSGSYQTDFSGEDLSSGIYFYTLYVDNNIIDTKKMILTK